MNHKNLRTLALGAAIAGSLAAVSVAHANPFSLTALGTAYMADGEGKCGGAKGTEGKCGEGKCGGDKAKGEGTCGGDKAKGEGTCGGDKAKGEGKCGEGKCGAKKEGEKKGEEKKDPA